MSMDLLDVPLVNISINITWQACFVLSCLLVTMKTVCVNGWINTITTRRRGNRRGNVDSNPDQTQKRGSITPDDIEASSTDSLMSTSAIQQLQFYRRQIRLSWMSKRCNEYIKNNNNQNFIDATHQLDEAFLDATQHHDEAFLQEPSSFLF